MALVITGYVDPGVYDAQVIVPSNVNVATTPVQLGIVGPGDRTKRITNEALQRALVAAEGAPSGLVFINKTGSITAPGISAPVSGVQTLNDTTASFPASVIGQRVQVAGATAAGNNSGTAGFLIVDRPSATSISYINPAGVVQAGAGGTYNVRPHYQLAYRSDHALQNTTLFRNGVVVGDQFIEYQPAYVQGDVTATRNLTSPNNALVLTMDGNLPITIRFVATAAATSIVQVGGTQFDVTLQTAAQPAMTPVTIAEIAAGINAVLVTAGASTLGYGAGYAGAAQSITAGLRIISPNTTPRSDVQILEPYVAGSGANAIGDLNAFAGSRLFTTYVAAVGIKAVSVLSVSQMVYTTTGVFKVDYINIDSNADALLQSGVQSIVRVGSVAGISNYAEATDYLLSGSSVSWGGVGVAPDLAPFYPPVGQVGVIDTTTYNPGGVGSTDMLKLAFDGRTAIDVDLVDTTSTIAGFNTGVAADIDSAAEVAQNINAVVANSAFYGPRYKAVAQVVNLGGGDFVQLTSPNEGQGAGVQILIPTANSANAIIFGLNATQTASVTGVGRRPILASVYFATYLITRPADAYNVQRRYYTTDQAQAELGSVSSLNPLMVATDLAFINLAPSVVIVQTNDSTNPGVPTRDQWAAAFTAANQTDLITDIVALTTDLAIQVDQKDHVEFASSVTQKHYRRGWFGMARSTPIGDKDTPGSYVYMARRTLQVAPDSPGRGRMILVAPPQLTGLTRNITNEDGSTQTLELDSTYLAVALAAKKSSFSSPADSLAKKTVTGFNITDVTAPWGRTERGVLAGQGSMVVTFDAGVFKVLDPVTTEVGGGGLADFSYESCSSQGDNITRKIDLALDAGVIGIVPTDLVDFIVDIKLIIGGVIQGEIPNALGYYRAGNASTGAIRNIDLNTDIFVNQAPTDPTKFFFGYWYNLKFPALRLLGQHSTSNPFFAAGSST